MDYTQVTLNELKVFATEHPELSLTDLLFSSFRSNLLSKDVKNFHSIRDISDEEAYSLVNKARKFEKELLDEKGNVILVTEEDLK